MVFQDFLSLLSRCLTRNHITQAHAFMISRALDRENLLLGNFFLACSRLGFCDYAIDVFERQEDLNVFIYNTMIKALSQTDRATDAVYLFDKIQLVGFRPDSYSFPFVLKAAVHLNGFRLGREIHGQVVKFGLCSDVHVVTALIQTYSHCREIEEARQLFDEMPQRDLAVWNAMVSGYVKMSDVESAKELFDRMDERNVVTWTTVIAGYAQMNYPNEAIEVFRQMQLEGGIEPDEIAFVAVLSACANLGALDLGEWVHRVIEKRGLQKIAPLMNALIDMYAKSGSIEKALYVFEKMNYRSVITWTTMIAGLAFHGLGNKALDMFHRMEKENVKPNDVTFIAVLSACCHIGETALGRWYFDRMKSWYNIKPKIEHYGCLIDLLGRAGCLREAQHLIRNMPFKANAAIWGALLAAARLHGDIELGQNALRNLMHVEPHNSGNYALLSNLYATYGKWKETVELRKLMKEIRVKKSQEGALLKWMALSMSSLLEMDPILNLKT